MERNGREEEGLGMYDHRGGWLHSKQVMGIGHALDRSYLGEHFLSAPQISLLLPLWTSLDFSFFS